MRLEANTEVFLEPEVLGLEPQCFDLYAGMEYDSSEKSKSQRKRDMRALQRLSEVLIKLPERQLAKVNLSEAAREAVIEGRRLTRSAYQRQVRFIAKLIADADVEPIREAVSAFEAGRRAQTARFHRVEDWRDRLITEGDEVLQAFLETFPNADRQRVRQLARNARRELAAGRAPAAARTLLRYLNSLEEQ